MLLKGLFIATAIIWLTITSAFATPESKNAAISSDGKEATAKPEQKIGLTNKRFDSLSPEEKKAVREARAEESRAQLREIFNSKRRL